MMLSRRRALLGIIALSAPAIVAAPSLMRVSTLLANLPPPELWFAGHGRDVPDGWSGPFDEDVWRSFPMHEVVSDGRTFIKRPIKDMSDGMEATLRRFYG